MYMYLGGAANGPMDIEAMLATSSAAHPAGVLRLAQRAEDCGGPHQTIAKPAGCHFETRPWLPIFARWVKDMGAIAFCKFPCLFSHYRL